MGVPMRKNRAIPPPEECPLKMCMNFLGGAWTPNILWYLHAGPRRFSELKADLDGVSAKVLSARLKELEEAGVLERKVMQTSPPTVEYRLSELGQELQPAISAIVSVGHRLKRIRAQRLTRR